MKRIDKDIFMSDLLYKSLYSELSEDEQTMLDCWLKNETNRAFYQELIQPEKLYENISEMADLDTVGYYRRLQRQMNHKRRLRIWLAIASVAAILVLLVGILGPFRTDQTIASETPCQFVGQYPVDQTILKTEEGEVYILDDSIKEIETKKILQKSLLTQLLKPVAGEKKVEYNLLVTSSRGSIEVTLADSTRVWLNSGSRLRYPNRFTTVTREVELVGEAYFEVARNEQQPFIVKADVARIEVLGTRFNVKAQPGAPCVTTLIEGCVKVRNKINDTVVIYPGQQVNTFRESTMMVKVVNPHFYIAWKRNRFAFQNESLYQIMEQLSEWYDCTFEFSSPQLANLHFTTILPRYDDISQVLGILQATREFGFVESGRHIYISDYEDVN